eukprot:3713389-Rhodomonas_salina.2
MRELGDCERERKSRLDGVCGRESCAQKCVSLSWKSRGRGEERERETSGSACSVQLKQELTLGKATIPSRICWCSSTLSATMRPCLQENLALAFSDGNWCLWITLQLKLHASRDSNTQKT